MLSFCRMLDAIPSCSVEDFDWHSKKTVPFHQDIRKYSDLVSYVLLSIFYLTTLILALLPISPELHSISSNFCTCIFTWSCSTRTELLQKGSLLVLILTGGDRISICFFEPGDLRFRPDSGQMEEDLVALLLELLNQIIFVLEELQQAQDQSEEDLIVYCSLLLLILIILVRLYVCFNFMWSVNSLLGFLPSNPSSCLFLLNFNFNVIMQGINFNQRPTS